MVRNKLTMLLQIFFQFMIYFKVILKSIKGPDDTCQGDLQGYLGQLATMKLLQQISSVEHIKVHWKRTDQILAKNTIVMNIIYHMNAHRLLRNEVTK